MARDSNLLLDDNEAECIGSTFAHPNNYILYDSGCGLNGGCGQMSRFPFPKLGNYANTPWLKISDKEFKLEHT